MGRHDAGVTKRLIAKRQKKKVAAVDDMLNCIYRLDSDSKLELASSRKWWEKVFRQFECSLRIYLECKSLLERGQTGQGERVLTPTKTTICPAADLH